MPYGAPRLVPASDFNAVVNGDVAVFQNDGNNTVPNAGVQVTAAGSRYFDGPDCFLLIWSSANNFNVTWGRGQSHPFLGTNGWSTYYANAGGTVFGGTNRWLSQATYIEGLNLANLLGLPATLSFFVMSPFAGRHYCTVFASPAGANVGGPASGASCVMPYTIPTANAWTKVTLPLDLTNALFTAPTFAAPSRSIVIHWPLQVGSDFFTTNFNSWIASPSNGLAGSDTPQFGNIGLGSIFRVTNVSLRAGSASDFPYQTIQEKLAACQRYYWTTKKMNDGTQVPIEYRCRIAGVFDETLPIYYPVAMRAAPTVSLNNTILSTSVFWRNSSIGANSGAISTIQRGEKYCTVLNPQVAGDAAGNTIRCQGEFDARMT